MDRAKEIFLDAIELDEPAARVALIEQAANGDRLLKRRVLNLLAAHDQADDVIVEPTVHPLKVDDFSIFSTSPASQKEPTEPPGTVVGEYVIERVLGEGGFGTVYLARQEQPVQRRVALKIIRAAMAGGDFVRRFEIERQALAVMDHPGIAKVFDAGKTHAGLGRPYSVMEYVDGVPITEFCDRQKLSIEERLRLFVDVCMAVQHAHSKGVIHRDLKPGNVMVTLIDGKPYPKVIDFGIAKALDDRHNFAADITAPQQIVGTPQYMAPEQAALDDVDIDTRADVYSLGAILYELLTGTPVFASERLRGLRPSQLEKIICEEEPQRPSSRIMALAGDMLAGIATSRGVDPARLPRQLSRDLDWICMRALEKDRGRRYPTALSLAEDLQRHLRDEPVEACPPKLNYRFAKFARRHRVEFAAVATVALALIALAVGAVWFAVREKRANRLAQEQLAKATALAKFSQDILGGVDPAEARGMDTTLLRKILSGASQQVDAKLANEPAAAAAMLNAIGYAYLQIENFEEAEKSFYKSLNRGRKALSADDAQVLQAHQNLAAVYAATNRYEYAVQMLVEVLAARKRVLGPDSPETVLTASNLANVYEKMGKWEDALVAFDEVVNIRRRTLGPDHLDTLTALNNYANCLDNVGRKEEAVPIFERVLAAQEARLAPDHPRTLQTMNNLASAYREVGRRDEARTLFERALELKKRVHGDDHSTTIVTMMNLASLYTDDGRLDDAERIYRRAIEVMAGKSSPGLPRVAALNGLAMVLKERKQPDESEIYLAQAVEAAREVMGEKHPNLIVLLSNLSSIRLACGKPDKAEEAARQSIALEVELGMDKKPATFIPRRSLARALAAQNRHAEAATVLVELLQLMPDMRESSRIDVIRECATFFERAGNVEEARRYRAMTPATQPSTQPTTEPSAGPGV